MAAGYQPGRRNPDTYMEGSKPMNSLSSLADQVEQAERFAAWAYTNYREALDTCTAEAPLAQAAWIAAMRDAREMRDLYDWAREDAAKIASAAT